MATLLIIDDDQDVVDLIRFLANRDGYKFLTHLETLSLSWSVLSESEITALASLPHLKQVVLNGNVLSAEQIARIYAMARAHRRPKQTVETPVPKGPFSAAPVSHPGRSLSEGEHLQSKSRMEQVAVPETTPELIPFGPTRTSIAVANAPKGQGMQLEVAVGRPKRSLTRTGLKRIHQEAVYQNTKDPELLPGESQYIRSPEENARSLGEIEVNAR